jgi:hypothetical protein
MEVDYLFNPITPHINYYDNLHSAEKALNDYFLHQITVIKTYE